MPQVKKSLTLMSSFLVLSVVLVPSSVNAEAIAKKSTSKQQVMTVREFVTVFLAGAPDDNQMSKAISAFAGFPEGAATKVDGVGADENEDGKDRTCSLVVETADDGKPSPVCLIVSARKKTETESFSHYFRISLEGKLERAFTVAGQIKDGKPVKGTGAQEPLDTGSKEVLGLMKKELEFWMKKYGKPAKKTASAGGSGSKIVAAQ